MESSRNDAVPKRQSVIGSTSASRASATFFRILGDTAVASMRQGVDDRIERTVEMVMSAPEPGEEAMFRNVWAGA